ncbi:DUF4785 domain-containing protein [Legionella sp. km772]|uniref:DUF4785 domain-containing protein n=1 Tax=Legionella sp. km772 TaxID=2498111 RepID=UPI000F8F130A|nr:DUF4785 domain-containing protein [Legionella sp. km772]RUR07333.1 DUF4785 family protein [Legionella sp. km772]
MNNFSWALSLMLIYSSGQAITLPIQTIKSYECERCGNLSHELLKDSWLLVNQPLPPISSNKQQSYSYRQKVSTEELQKGVALSLLGSRAIIRVSPINKAPSLALSLKTPSQKTMSLQEASSLYSENQSLEPSFSPNNETIVQIKPELGKGSFILKSLGQDHNNSSYMINVLDKFSLTHLDVETKSLFYHYGDILRVHINLNDEDNDYDAEDIEAFLVDPAGKTIPMMVKEINPNQFEASHLLTSEQSDNGENWYVKVEVEAECGEGTIKRSGQTAFSYSIPSATLIELKKQASSPLTFSAKVNVATASRYSLQGVLFKKTAQSLNALETAQTGIWLEPGIHSIEFTFDNSAQLAEDQLYLGNLRLIDYGQLKMVYQYDKPIQLSQLVE